MIETGTGEPDSQGRRRRAVVLVGAAIATLIAFRSVLVTPFGLLDDARFDYWFFIPDRDSAALSVILAVWLIWNRRKALASMRRQKIGPTHCLAALLVLLLFGWATWMRIQVQLIPILCVLLATLVAAWGGRSGLRLIVMPCAALLLSFPPPAPLQAEIVWRLQGITAMGSHLLLSLAGYASQLEGAEVRMGGHAFVIIEACSGWRGIQVLSLAALAASELCGLRFRRAIWVILAALPLGIVLNVLRACMVMLDREELNAAYFESHTPQGIAVLVIGSLVLYGIAAALRPRREEPSEAVAATDGPPAPDGKGRIAGAPPAWAAFSLAIPITLAVVSVALPVTRDPLPERPRYKFLLPESLPPWVGTRLELDYFFPYSTASNAQFHVDFRNTALPSGAMVDLFVARELPSASGLDRMPDSKLIMPANDWTVVHQEPARVLALGVDATKAIVTRGDGAYTAYVYAWRLHDRGLIVESLRSLVLPQDCERSPNECLRTVVRLVVPMVEDTPVQRERAAQAANLFINDYIMPLKSLEMI